MTDSEALLAAVTAHPGDDLPKLVLADWLDERGEADRAEHLRLVVEFRRPAADRDELVAKLPARRRLRTLRGRCW